MFSLFIIISCSQKVKIQGDNHLIKIDLQKCQINELSNLCSKIELIPLETSTESILGKVSKICESTECYYLLDSKQDILFKFRKDGQFVCSTKKNQGKGPGEYTSLTDFEINPFTGNIEILDARNLKMQTLNSDFIFKRSMSLDRELLPLSLFKIINKDIYVFPQKNTNGKDVLVFYSVERNRIIKEIELPETGSDLLMTAGNPFYTFNGQINYITKNSSNVLYCIDTTTLNVNESLKIDFGQNNISIDKLPKNKTQNSFRSFIEGNGMKYAYLYNISENDKYYIVHFNFQKKFFISKYHKATHKVFTFFSEYGATGQLAPPNLVSNNQLIYLSEPMYLKHYVLEDLMDESSKMLLSRVKENDNPVFIKYTLKNNTTK